MFHVPCSIIILRWRALLGFLVKGHFFAEFAEFLQFQALLRVLLVFGCSVIQVMADSAL